MGLLGTNLGEARVALLNLDTADVGAGEPVLARVEVDPAEPVDGHPALAYLLPLTAVTVLRNCHDEPELAHSMMYLLSVVADDALQGEDRSRALRVRAHAARTPAASPPAYDSPGLNLALGVPQVVDTDGPAFKTLRARLLTKRGNHFATIRGVGNAYQAAFGFFGLAEHVVRSEPYAEVVQPAMSAIGGISHTFFETLDGAPPTFAQARELNALTFTSVAAS